MHSKLDKPTSKDDFSNNNKGSSQRLFNYLLDNDKVDGLFFNQHSDSISKVDAVHLIDNNVKGFKKDELKFYSLSLNPSNEELEHIKNDKNKLVEYTRKAMENFASNIKNNEIDPKDLVWTAIIHDKRHYTNLDKNKFEKKNNKPFPYKTLEDLAKWQKDNPNKICPFIAETIKKGNNTHIHIVVSRKNKDMKKTITLHGRNSKDKFNLIQWQSNNQVLFQNNFSYRVGENLNLNFHERLFEKQYQRLNSKGYYINKEKILAHYNTLNDKDKSILINNFAKLNLKLSKGAKIDDLENFIITGQTNKEPLADNKFSNDLSSFIHENETIINDYDSVVSYTGKKKRRKKNLKNSNI